MIMLKRNLCKSLLVTALIASSLGVAALWDSHAGAPLKPPNLTPIKTPTVSGTLRATYVRSTRLATGVIEANCKGIKFIVGPRSEVMTEAAFNAATTQQGLKDRFLGSNLAPKKCFSAAGGEGLEVKTVQKPNTRSSPEGVLVVVEIVMLGAIEK
jgi:hypothetical protein